MTKYILILTIICFSIKLGFAQEQTLGLFLNSENAYDGYTLMSNNESTYLINNCGIIVNEWQSAYKTGHGCYILENGNLLRAGQVDGAFNAGGKGGIIEVFDWDNNLLWSHQLSNDKIQAHHDLAPLPNGNFLCTVWEKKSQAEAQAVGRIYDGDVWSEKILEIEMLANNQAKIVWEWSIWDHLIQDQFPDLNNYNTIAFHPELLDINYIGAEQNMEGNWLHINAIHYNPILDQIVISSRNLSEIYVIDHSTTTNEAKAHQGGKYGMGGDILYRYGNPQVYDNGLSSDQKLFNQHDIRWILSEGEYTGHFSVFNNHFIQNKQSRVEIFKNPSIDGHYIYDTNNGFGNDETLKKYTRTNLYSDILSGAQHLPNGNILILEGRSGHITEIDKNDRLVWEYIYPVNRNGLAGIQGGEPKFNTLFRVKKYAADYIGFKNKNLSPTSAIEKLPLPTICELFSIYKPPTDTSETQAFVDIKNTIVNNELIINNQFDREIIMIIFSVDGKNVLTTNIQKGENNLDLHYLFSGIYFVQLKSNQGHFDTVKIIKL